MLQVGEVEGVESVLGSSFPFSRLQEKSFWFSSLVTILVTILCDRGNGPLFSVLLIKDPAGGFWQAEEDEEAVDKISCGGIYL